MPKKLVTPKDAHRNDDDVIIRRSAVTVIYTVLVYCTFYFHYLPQMSTSHEQQLPLCPALIFTTLAMALLYFGQGVG